MQMSTLESYQYSNNTTMLCIWARERCRLSVWKRLQKKNHKEKTTSLMLNFPLTKNSQQHKTTRRCKTLMKSNIVSIGP